MPWNVCRICLAGDSKMYSVANTKLFDIFEKVTGNVWDTDKRPSTLCYICFHQLANCLKLREMAKLSEEVFTQFFAGGFEFTEETAPMLNERKLHKYLVTPVQDFSVGVFRDTNEVAIKKEDGDESCLKETSIGGNDSTRPQEHNKNNNDGNLVKDDVHNDVVPNHSAMKNEDHEMENMDAIMKYDGSVSSDNENIPIQNEVKIPNGPKSQNKGNEKKTDCKDLNKPKRNVYFTLKFNITNNNNIKQKSKDKLNVTDDRTGYTCKYCEKSYKVKYGLEKHLRNHEENVYECKYCSKTFLLKSLFKLHQETHRKLQSLKKMSDTDTGRNQKEKSQLKYECELCKKSFNQLSNLQQHVRTHTGKRPYKCETCGKRCRQLSNLKQHKRVHSGDKPYQCNSCHKSFTQLSNLEQHRRQHHAE